MNWMETFTKIIGIFALTVISIVLNAFVIVKLWSWFIISIFEVNPLTIPQAMGFSLLISFLTHTPKKEKSEQEFYDVFIRVAVTAGVTLLLGWVVHLFM